MERSLDSTKFIMQSMYPDTKGFYYNDLNDPHGLPSDGTRVKGDMLMIDYRPSEDYLIQAWYTENCPLSGELQKESFSYTNKEFKGFCHPLTEELIGLGVNMEEINSKGHVEGIQPYLDALKTY